MPISGSSSAQGSTSGTILLYANLAGTAAAVAQATVTALKTLAQAAGEAVAAGSTSVNLTASVLLSGASTGYGTVSGSVVARVVLLPDWTEINVAVDSGEGSAGAAVVERSGRVVSLEGTGGS